MSQLVEDKKAPGIIFLLYEKGKTRFLQKYGWQDIENEILLEFDAIFRIYSMTKPIITIALMMLFEERKFKLNDPISKFLPEFKDMKVFVKEENGKIITEELEREITILDLFTHTSGLGSKETDDPIDKQYKEKLSFDKTKVMSLEQVITVISSFPLRFQPGRYFKYSYGLDVLGRLIEVLSEKPLDEFLKERVFHPLEMEDTAFYVPREKLDRFIKIYTYNEDNTLEVVNTPSEIERYDISHKFFSGGGGLVSTIKDFFNFASIFLNKGIFKGNRLLSPETIDLITKNHLKNNQTIPDLVLDRVPDDNYFLNLTGYGQGLGIRVLIEEGIRPTAIGEHGWGGAAETFYWVDPLNKVLGIFMTQLIPDLTNEIWRVMQLAYSGLGL
ncbi:MAG: serine hydrolase domain-containing protein [Promethearchaeota archaeon]